MAFIFYTSNWTTFATTKVPKSFHYFTYVILSLIFLTLPAFFPLHSPLLDNLSSVVKDKHRFLITQCSLPRKKLVFKGPVWENTRQSK